jgi:hypothetical protein
MTVTSTTAMLVGTPEMLGAKDGAVTVAVPKVEIEEALQSDAPLELILDVLRTEEEATEAAAHEIAVAWERQDLESLVSGTAGDSIIFSFDQTELERVLADEDFEGHGLRERAMILTVAAAAASAAASSASAMPYADTGSGAAIVQTAVPSAHDEATLAERGIGVQPASAHDEATLAARGIEAQSAAAGHDEATLVARGIDAQPAAATHDEATASARGIGVAPVIGSAQDEATLGTRGIDPQPVPATHDEATLVGRGIETPAVAAPDSGFDLPAFDAGTAAAVGGLAGAGLVIAAAGFVVRRRREPGTA